MNIPGMIFDSVANFVRPPAAGYGLRLYGSSSGSVGLKPAAAAGSVDYQLPAADGANTNVLQTNGAGVLSWVAAGGGGGGTGGNPTALVGLSAVNGSASTFIRSDGAPALDQSIAPTWTGSHVFAKTAGTGTQSPGITFTGAAHTALTASTESNAINLNCSSTKQFATGALTTQREILVQAPTYAFVGASTITTACTVEINGAPLAGTNATITNQIGMRILTGVATGIGLVVKGATSQSANLLELRDVNDTPKFTVSASGATTASNDFICAGQIQAGVGQKIKWNNATEMLSQQDGNLLFIDSGTELTFGLMKLGGTSSSYPAIKRSAATLAFRLADDSGDCAISCAAATLSGNLTISAKNIVTDTTTGTKIGTAGGAAGQKLAFFNSTPIVQPLLATGASHTVDDVITTLQNLGLVRQS